MLPYQIKSIAKKFYRSAYGSIGISWEHMAVGMDTLVVTKILDRLESQMEVVILPPFSYGAASYAVAAPEQSGTLHVDSSALAPLAEQLFTVY